MNLLKKLKNYKILYCEDDETIAKIFLLLLKKLSNNFIYAENGEEGLKLYHSENPDIIITDVEMPKKSGIEMIADIRKENKNIPIIITTAYGSGDFLVKVIDLNINKFLIKPVKKNPLLNTLENIIAHLEDKKLADKYRAEQEIEKLKKNTKEIIIQFSEVFIEPIIIVKNNKITNINKTFEKLFNDKKMKLLLNNINYLDNLIEKRKGFCHSIVNLNEENSYENKISIKNHSGKRKIFQVIVKKIYFKEDTDESTIYIFNNITYLEYQKLKVENYSKRLEDFIIASKYKKTPIIDIKKIKIKKLKTKQQVDIKLELNNKKERTLDNKEAKLLRKNHSEKISAPEFISSLDDYVIEDIQELQECEEDIDIELDKFLETSTKEILDKIILNMEKYGKAIKNLQEFDELYEAINSTINILKNIEVLDDDNIPKIKLFIENIMHDLKNWRITIFEDSTTKDIHYLDSSLFSSCLQFELDLKGEKPEEDEGDFEFF